MRKPIAVRRLGPALAEAHVDPGACFPIGVVADLLGVTEQTLRLYESQGLIKPARRSRERYYCAGDVQWLECLRHLVHAEKVSIAGVKRLLHFAPCWDITGFVQERPCGQCPVHKGRSGGPVVNGNSGRVAMVS